MSAHPNNRESNLINAGAYGFDYVYGHEQQDFIDQQIKQNKAKKPAIIRSKVTNEEDQEQPEQQQQENKQPEPQKQNVPKK